MNTYVLLCNLLIDYFLNRKFLHTWLQHIIVFKHSYENFKLPFQCTLPNATLKDTKMKTLLITAGIALLSLTSAPSSAHSKQVVTTDSSADSSLCAAIIKDKPVVITKRLKQARLRKHQAKEVLFCNGLSLSEFAQKHNSYKAIAHLRLEPSQEQLANNNIVK